MPPARLFTSRQILRKTQQMQSDITTALEVMTSYLLHLKNRIMEETHERAVYRWRCKHFSYENCMKRSGWYGGLHILMGCDGNCRRMKNYDRRLRKEQEDLLARLTNSENTAKD